MLAVMLATQAFTPHAAQTARVIIVLIIAASVIFGRRLLYLLAYGLIIFFAVAIIVGAVTLVHIMHGLSRHSHGNLAQYGAMAASTGPPATKLCEGAAR